MRGSGGWHSTVGRWGPLVLLAALTIAAILGGWHKHVSLTSLAAHEEDLRDVIGRNRALALLGYAMLYAAATALSLPGGAALTIAGGFLFGWLAGGIAAHLGATAGAVLVFLIARTAITEPLRSAAGPRLGKLAEGFRKDAFNYLLFLRVVPVFPFWLVNLAPALLDVRLRTFFLATVIGIIPGVFVFAILGSGLGGVIAAERAEYATCVAAKGHELCHFKIHLKNLVSPGLLVAFAALGAFALLPVLVKKRRRSSR